MTDGKKDVPIQVGISGYNKIDIPIVVSLQDTGSKDIPIIVSLRGEGTKDIPVAANLETYRVDYGMYGVSVYETSPRHTFFFAQGGTPDKSAAVTDPYWYLKSGNSESGTEGFAEFGIGQTDDLDRTDTQLTTFVRIAQDANEGWVKIKPSLWFYPSSEPTTPQEGMMYYDSTTHEFRYYDDAGWLTVGDVSGTQWTLPVIDTTNTLGDSMIRQNSTQATAADTTMILQATGSGQKAGFTLDGVDDAFIDFNEATVFKANIYWDVGNARLAFNSSGALAYFGAGGIETTGDVTVGGNIDVDGGTIEVEDTFEITYNSTSESLDFNYIG